jgi:DNA modification methylase
MRLIHGDSLKILPTLEAASVDAVITDPPAGIAFMGKGWDSFGGRANKNAERDRSAAKTISYDPRFNQTVSPFPHSGSVLPTGPEQRAAFVAFLTAALAECLRVAKPGARLLCWAIPRTSHWTGTAIEDAGWVIEDRISHLFGQGFPKARSKLKPACEDWWLARKPGPKVLPLPGLDGCRVGTGERPLIQNAGRRDPRGDGFHGKYGSRRVGATTAGRWPANLVLSHVGGPDGCRRVGTKRVKGDAKSTRGSDAGNQMYGGGKGLQRPTAGQAVGYADDDGRETVEAWECHPECPVRLLDEQSGESRSPARARGQGLKSKAWRAKEGRNDHDNGKLVEFDCYGDTGGASRFFYCAKASRRERNAGLEGMPEQSSHAQEYHDPERVDVTPGKVNARLITKPQANHHPTVKPQALMRWLCRLITPPGGVVLDPFLGSGSTAVAAIHEGFDFVGIEREAEYYAIAERRIAAAQKEAGLFAGAG